MNLYKSSLDYFHELSHIPRMSLHEEKVRTWIIKWAEESGWTHQTDAIGNLLVVAPGNKEKRLCLQAHMDMVCVADEKHNFETHGITIVEKDGKITAKKTSLGADNGIGIATMMAVTEIPNRPTLELLFTIGEEIGLIGAQHISLPVTAKEGLNLDWCDSKTIGIGCGGTLLMQGLNDLTNISPHNLENQEEVFLITLHGMQGGHSGEDIRHYRGNALIEILKIIQELKNITYIGDISGGEADNAIPHSAKVTACYSGNPNLLKNELSHFQKILRTKYKYDTISLSVEKSSKTVSMYRKEDIFPILSQIIDTGTGVQVWGKQNTPLSSWNIGILSLKKTLSTSYFLRTNLQDGMEPMRYDIMAGLPGTTWTMSHESPPWNNNFHSEFLGRVKESFLDEENQPIPLLTTHAAVEAGLLSKKYPQTEWVSVGATISDMHTTRESIKTKDFEEFIERIEYLLTLF